MTARILKAYDLSYPWVHQRRYRNLIIYHLHRKSPIIELVDPDTTKEREDLVCSVDIAILHAAD